MVIRFPVLWNFAHISGVVSDMNPARRRRDGMKNNRGLYRINQYRPRTNTTTNLIPTEAGI